jgi:hypothetical protein
VASSLVGREAELEQIATEREARDARGIVLRAPAGAGKTAVARAAASEAEADGLYVEWVLATRSAATVPLGALAGLMEDVDTMRDPMERMVRAAHVLRARAGGRRALLVVDDGQYLDPSSAALVLHVATSATAFVLTTVRTGEACPDAVEALWKDAGAARLELAPLDAAAIRGLAEASLGGPVEGRLAAWLVDRSEGNALYACELLSGARAADAIQPRGGVWMLERRPAPSASLVDAIGARLEQLPVSERRALELLALGEPLAPRVFDTELLLSLEERALITTGGGMVRSGHPLYADVTRATMASLRTQATLRRLADLVPADGSSETTLRRVRWLMDAGETLPTPLLLDAAAAAIDAGAPRFAVELGARAAQVDDNLETALLLARALWLDGRAPEAEAALAGWEGRIEDPELAARFLEVRGMVQSWGLDNGHDETGALLERAAGWFATPERAAALAGVRVQFTVGADHSQGPLRAAERQFAEAATDPGAALSYSRALHWSGRGADARRVVRDALPTGIPGPDVEILLMSVFVYGTLDTGIELAELEAYAHGVLERTSRTDAPAATAIAATAVARVRAFAGRFREAPPLLAEAAEHHTRQDVFGGLHRVRTAQVYVDFMLGDASEAVERFRAEVDPTSVHPALRPYLAQGSAWAAMADGDPSAAQRIALEASDRPVGRYPAAALAYDALRMGAPAKDVAPRLAALRERTDGPLTAAYAAHAQALVARSGRDLLAAAGHSWTSAPYATRASARPTRHGPSPTKAARTQPGARPRWRTSSMPKGHRRGLTALTRSRRI